MSQLRRERKRRRELPILEMTGRAIPARPDPGCKRSIVKIAVRGKPTETLVLEYPTDATGREVAAGVAEYLRGRELRADLKR